MARNARILYVYSNNVMDALQFAIDQNLAQVISVSYGLCELRSSSASLRSYQTWARQANAQGITWVNAAGDSGGADCAAGTSAITGLAVDAPASVPEVTGIGGTTLTASMGTYWNTTNNSTDESVLSYIPETVWNDSTTGSPAAGGGGLSVFFAKPAWQTGLGVPNTGARTVPDISLAVSANHNGYLVYTGGSLSVFGGTSAGTSVFAGMIALLNQYLAQGTGTGSVGNINPRLYSLAQTLPSAFHDVTSGTNAITVTCGARRNCSTGSYGHSAGVGYDLASRLGSVDFYNLVTWKTEAGTPATTNMTLTSTAATISVGDTVRLTATVVAPNGAVPLGGVTFRLGNVILGTAALIAGPSQSTATWSLTGSNLSAGPNTIVAEYGGNTSYTGANASTTITVTQLSDPWIAAFTNAASFRSVYAPGMLMSVFGSQLAPATLNATSLPLPQEMAGVSVTINELPAPLMYVSPTSLNIQIPYEVAIDSPLTVAVNNNGRIATGSVITAQSAPGIFIDINSAPIYNASAARGQIGTLYITGAGAISPAVATGFAPDPGTIVSNLPRPQQSLSVMVGGVSAPLQFVGIPWGSVGVVQVNYQIPNNVPLGTNAVVVQIGNATSAEAYLTIVP